MQRSIIDRIIGRWYEPTPKRHRFVSCRGRIPDRYVSALKSLWTFAEAKILRRYRAGLPWLPYSVLEWLDHQILRPEMRVLEIGAGQSTVYFSRRVRSVISVENDPAWRERVLGLVREHDVTILPTLPDDLDGYVRTADLVLLDDEPREALALQLYRGLKPGAWLLIDNWDWPRFDAVRPRDNSRLEPSRIYPTRVFTDFAPYNFAVNELAAFYKPQDQST